MPRVVFFELPVDDPDRAIQFYSNVFGWRIHKMPGMDGEGDYWLISTGEDANVSDGGLMPRAPGRTTTTNTIDVPSVDEYVDKIVAQGGAVVAPKMPIPGVGYLAYCTDTEGTVFGILQPDAAAA